MLVHKMYYYLNDNAHTKIMNLVYTHVERLFGAFDELHQIIESKFLSFIFNNFPQVIREPIY